MEKTLPVMRGKYVQGPATKAAQSRLSAHLKYNQYRKLGEQEQKEDRYLFTQEADHVYRQDAVNDIMAHATRVLYHKIVLSPAPYEHIDDFRQWTREVMTDLEARKGQKLHWYAVVQAHEREQIDEPHVHLVLAGGSLDEKEKLQLVRMDVKDYAFLREQGREHSNFEFYQEQERMLDQLNAEDQTLTEYREKTPFERSDFDMSH